MQRAYHSAPSSSLWPGRLHLALTALLVLAMASVAGLVLAGRVHFDPVARKPEAEPTKKNAEPAETKAASRIYQIEKLDDCRDVLNRCGRSRYFGEPLVDAWVFKYRGGLLECRLEGELFGNQPPLVLPASDDFQRLLKREEGIQQGSPALADRSGFIILTASPTSDELARHHVHVGGLLAFGSYGPLHVLPPLNLEVNNTADYRLFVSIGPPAGGSGAGTNLWTERAVKVRTLIIPRDTALEEFHAGASNDLKQGKEELILDRQRGYSRIRLKARFLGDGEVQALIPK